jgi:hypothetical protein
MVKYSRVLGGRMTDRSGALCAVCTMHKEMMSASWFSLKTKVDGFIWFGLKTGGSGSCGLASKPLARVSQLGPQNRQLQFGDLSHKISATVS